MLISSSLPSDVGLCAGDLSGVADYVNRAQLNLLYDPIAPDEGWWGGWVRMKFNVAVVNGHAYIRTPRDIARLILIDVCRHPVKLRNSFYEFLEFGRGLQPRNQIGGACCSISQTTEGYERDSVVTLLEQTVSPAKIRFYPSDSADVGLTVLLQGNDQNGLPVTSVDLQTQAAILGEQIVLAVPFIDSAFLYTAPLTGIQKAASQGQVQIFQVDPVTGIQSALSTMDANETTAQYRHYLINGLPPTCLNMPGGIVQVEAQAKLDFVPVQSASDYLIIPNIPAVIEEAKSIWYSRMDSPNATAKEAKHHAKAIALLCGQLDHYEGKISTAVAVPIFGSDRLRAQPV